MFDGGTTLYQEDLHYMPVKVCEYYFRAFAEFMISDVYSADAEDAMYFIHALTALESEIRKFSAEGRDFLISAAE